MKYKTSPLLSVVNDGTGGNIKVQRGDYIVSGAIPVIDQGQDFIGGYTDDRLAIYRGVLPCVIFGDHTRAIKYIDFPFALGADGVKVLTPIGNGLNAKFLYHYLSSVNIPSHGYSRHFKFLKEIQVPLPPLDEQRRIVDILDHAASIRRLREQAQTKVREIIPALFVDMFGDPATNPKGWPVKALGDIIDRFEGGKNLQAGDDVAGSGLRILKVSAVTSGYFLSSENKPAPNDYKPPSNHFVRMGDLLFSRANTVDLVGATAFVHEKPTNILLPDKLWRFVWKERSIILPFFMLHFLQQRHTRVAMSRMATGTSDSMKNISQAKLVRLPTLVPPLGLQQEFAERASEIEAMATLNDAATHEAERLAQSLMSQVFGANNNML